MPAPSPDRTRIYAAFIADGYLYEVEARDDDTPEGAGYWIGLRLAEVSCPACGGEGSDVCATCPNCEGCGYSTGEPFTVTRYEVPEGADVDALIEAIEDGGDGYERAGILARLLGEGTDVLEWEPETVYACSTCRRSKVDPYDCDTTARNIPEGEVCDECDRVETHHASCSRLEIPECPTCDGTGRRER